MSAFLDYIADNMIVADKSKRDRSHMVKRRLRKFLQDCENISDYTQSPNSASWVSESSDAETSSGPPRIKLLADQNKETMISWSKRWVCLWVILSLGVIQMSHYLRSLIGG